MAVVCHGMCWCLEDHHTSVREQRVMHFISVFVVLESGDEDTVILALLNHYSVDGVQA